MEDFYAKCWFQLKLQRPKLRKEMDDVELLVLGLTTKSTKKPKKTGTKNVKKDDYEVPVI